MGKILLTNVYEWNHNLRESFEKSGFCENGSIKKEHYLTTYSKLNVNTENIYVDADEYIACCGTMIYKSLIGKKALSELLSDLKVKKIDEIRKDMLGSYAVIYSINNIINCFVDETGTYALYYYNQNGKYIFTNTYYHIEKEVHQELNALGLLERHIENCIIGSSTPFNNIYRVLADEHIVIKCDDNMIEKNVINRNNYQLRGQGITEIAEELNAEAMEILKKSKNVLISPQLFLTGGVDSRLILANYLAMGIKPTLGAWCGAPITMNTKDEDYKTVVNIATYIGLEKRIYDMSACDYYKDIEEKDFDKFGEYATIYNNNSAWHSILADKKTKYADYGYFGETLKEWKELEGINDERVTLNWFIDKYISRYGLENPEEQIAKYKEFYDNLYRQFEWIAMGEHIDINNMSREDCMHLYYWYRLYADTLVYQYANMFCYAFPLYAQKKIADLINAVPYKYKENEKLNLKMEQLLYDKLLDIPFYSHCQQMKFDKEKMMLTVKVNTKVKLKKKVSEMLLKNRYGKKILDLYHKKVDNGKIIERNECKEIILLDLNASSSFKAMNLEIDKRSTGYIPSLVLMAQECKMVDQLLNRNAKGYDNEQC